MESETERKKTHCFIVAMPFQNGIRKIHENILVENIILFSIGCKRFHQKPFHYNMKQKHHSQTL